MTISNLECLRLQPKNGTLVKIPYSKIHKCKIPCKAVQEVQVLDSSSLTTHRCSLSTTGSKTCDNRYWTKMGLHYRPSLLLRKPEDRLTMIFRTNWEIELLLPQLATTIQPQCKHSQTLTPNKNYHQWCTVWLIHKLVRRPKGEGARSRTVPFMSIKVLSKNSEPRWSSNFENDWDKSILKIKKVQNYDTRIYSLNSTIFWVSSPNFKPTIKHSSRSLHLPLLNFKNATNLHKEPPSSQNRNNHQETPNLNTFLSKLRNKDFRLLKFPNQSSNLYKNYNKITICRKKPHRKKRLSSLIIIGAQVVINLRFALQVVGISKFRATIQAVIINQMVLVQNQTYLRTVKRVVSTFMMFARQVAQ
jgi:hypothetical protein